MSARLILMGTLWALVTSAGLATADEPQYEVRDVRGWTVHIHEALLKEEAEKTARALVLLEKQLAEVIDNVPPAAVQELQKVPLWMSPLYPNFSPRAEYHPQANWLKQHGRNQQMVRSIEFTNISIFDDEYRRMPNFVLHELAHAFHHRVLGFEEPRVQAAYEAARDAGIYEQVERKNARGKVSIGRHYALTNAKEYFAESTEAYFSTNDFFPYRNADLKQVDPKMHTLLAELWGVTNSKDSDR